MRIGLYFGSFNPIHIGHLIIANHILNESNIQKIWFIVSPQNPFKNPDGLLNEYDRLHLIQKSVEDDPRIKVSDIEFTLPKPSFTIHTLAYLKEKFPSEDFSLIMGSDSFQNLGKWKNAETIISNYSILIYRRPGYDVVNQLNANIRIMDAPLLEISSTYIRELTMVGKSIKYLVPSKVEEDIVANGFFKKRQKNNQAKDKPPQ